MCDLNFDRSVGSHHADKQEWRYGSLRRANSAYQSTETSAEKEPSVVG